MSSELETLYQQLILDHSRHPDGFGDTTGWQPQSRQINPTCGDDITLALRLEGGRIAEVRWQGSGCAISQASASLLAGLAEARTTDEALVLAADFREVMHSRGKLELDPEQFGDAVALNGVSKYLGRIKCAMLGWVALEHAVADAASASSP